MKKAGDIPLGLIVGMETVLLPVDAEAWSAFGHVPWTQVVRLFMKATTSRCRNCIGGEKPHKSTVVSVHCSHSV